MADLSNHVTLSITRDTVGLQRAGFGVGLYLSGLATFAERTREFAGLAELAADTQACPSTTSPEYLAAQAWFSQSPTGSKFKIGKSLLPATQVYTLVPIATNSTTYSLTVAGKGFATTTVSYTADSSATIAEIVAGLITVLNAVASKNYTASGTTTLILTASGAGEWFSVSLGNLNQWTSCAQTHVDPGVATDLANICLEDNDWYCLLTGYNSNAYVLAAAAWAQANGKIYLAETNDSSSALTATGNSETLDDLKTAGYSRVAGVYGAVPAEFLAAGWAGARLWTDPGAETWADCKIAGMTSTNFTSTQRGHITTRFANALETVGSLKVMFGGTTSDGDFIDVTRGLDWLDDDMRKSIYEAMVKASVAGGKVPFTDAGIALIVGVVRGSLRRAAARGIIDGSTIVVTYPKVADISPADKAARLLSGIKFSATLQGAIHKVAVTGVVSV